MNMMGNIDDMLHQEEVRDKRFETLNKLFSIALEKLGGEMVVSLDEYNGQLVYIFESQILSPDKILVRLVDIGDKLSVEEGDDNGS